MTLTHDSESNAGGSSREDKISAILTIELRPSIWAALTSITAFNVPMLLWNLCLKHVHVMAGLDWKTSWGQTLLECKVFQNLQQRTRIRYQSWCWWHGMILYHYKLPLHKQYCCISCIPACCTSDSLDHCSRIVPAISMNQYL